MVTDNQYTEVQKKVWKQANSPEKQLEKMQSLRVLGAFDEDQLVGVKGLKGRKFWGFMLIRSIEVKVLEPF